MNNQNALNIRPETSVYGTYKRLSYKPWYAIAEFIDNSTQSYYDHKEVLTGIFSFNKLIIQIKYDSSIGVLEIEDNAFGMNFSEFERAIKLDIPPENKTGRNEFGMGLKTAACWFGNTWSVETTAYGSTKQYKATIDVKELQRTKSENIYFTEEDVSLEVHRTKIRITDLNQIPQKRTISKIKSLLSSIYRVDLRRGDIEIIWNDEKLNFTDIDVLTEINEDGLTKVWKKDVSFDVYSPNGEKYNVDGWIGIRAKGDASSAGLILLRRGRVIIGGDQSYKPEEVFGKGNSFESQRLFGELNMDKWPVTQAKDGFDWFNGLEDNFIKELEKITAEYAYKARNYRVNDSKKISELTSSQKSEIITTTVESISNAVRRSNSMTEEETYKMTSEPLLKMREQDSIYTFSIEGYTVNVKWVDEDENYSWLTVEDLADESSIMLNIRHRFFVPFIHRIEFLTLINQFAVAMVIAERRAKSITTDENLKIDPSSVRMQMNKLLLALSTQE